MTGATITIRRQVLSVGLRGTEAEGLALQRRLPAVCAEVVAPALASGLERFDPGDDLLVIERLEIDLPGVRLDRLTDGLADALRRAVQDALRRPVEDGSLGLPTSAGTTAGADAGSNPIERRSVARTADDALVAFLATGRLPWSFRLPAGTTLERTVTGAWADGEPGPADRSRLLRILAAPAARTRLRLQFSRTFVLTVLRSVAPPLAASLDEVMRTLDEAGYGRPGTPAPAAPEALTARLIVAALADDPAGHRPTARELVRRALLSRPARPVTPSEGGPLLALLERRWPGVTGNGPGKTAAGESEGAAPQREAIDSGRTSRTSSTTPVDADRASAGATHRDGPEARTAGMVAAGTGVEEASEGIMVANAGIVLLAPFLPRLFDGLGLVAADELLDPGRAICLLHHLATGELTAPEHEVPLVKVLCGRSLDEPTPSDVGLTRTETDEATALLTAAIGHWTALRDTSPDGLRHEFLRRPGILSIADRDEWLLRVETRTADILLDQLPWGIAMVGLPWMPRMLQVEWR